MKKKNISDKSTSNVKDFISTILSFPRSEAAQNMPNRRKEIKTRETENNEFDEKFSSFSSENNIAFFTFKKNKRRSIYKQ